MYEELIRIILLTGLAFSCMFSLLTIICLLLDLKQQDVDRRTVYSRPPTNPKDRDIL